MDIKLLIHFVALCTALYLPSTVTADNHSDDSDIGGLIGAPGTTDASDADTLDSSQILSCYQEGEIWEKGSKHSKPRNIKSKNVFMVFDEFGNVCYQSKAKTRITEGDLIYIGIFARASTLEDLRLDIPVCSLETTDLQILDTGELADFVRQADKFVLRKSPQPYECYDDEISIQARRSNQALVWEKTVRQYQRFHGSFQIGAIWTDLDDVSYSTIDLGSGPQIKADRDDSSGPEYVGSLVVYGIPYYFSTLFSDARYSGRDIINENNIMDRLGLAFSFGLSDPEDTLGIGLSFELATGINVTATQLYRRIDTLDGVAVGDAFTGSTIPTQKTWEDELVWGLSIDMRYLTKFFGGSSK